MYILVSMAFFSAKPDWMWAVYDAMKPTIVVHTKWKKQLSTRPLKGYIIHLLKWQVRVSNMSGWAHFCGQLCS